MADERETIIAHIKTILDGAGGAKFISRNFQIVLTGQIDEMPATFVLDLGDEGEHEVNGRAVHKELLIGLFGVLKGSSGEGTAPEMAAYLRANKKVFYEQILECEYVLDVEDEGTSPLTFHSDLDNVVRQSIQFRIKFIESVVDLVNE